MAVYTFSREVGASGWNVPNKNRDFLKNEIIAAGLSGLQRIDCDDSVVNITFSSDLNAGDQTTLTTVVATHKTGPV